MGEGRGADRAVKVMVKGAGLTTLAVTSIARLWAPEDMEIWVAWTRSEIDGRRRSLPGTGRLGRTGTKTVRVVEVWR